LQFVGKIRERDYIYKWMVSGFMQKEGDHVHGSV